MAKRAAMHSRNILVVILLFSNLAQLRSEGALMPILITGISRIRSSHGILPRSAAESTHVLRSNPNEVIRAALDTRLSSHLRDCLVKQ